MTFTPRPSQQQILRYDGGRLGIAAVPGAGKTHILSALAAKIIQSGTLQDEQEVLIVTLVNSAVDNFKNRLESFFDNKLASLYKYRVRTLHGLAHDIVREKPASVGLENRFSIIDERESNLILKDAVTLWLATNESTFIDNYFDPGLSSEEINRAKRNQNFGLNDTVEKISVAFIKSCKDRLINPESLRAKLDASPTPLPLAELGWSIYADYQRALAYRGAVDFDDLIRLALTLLENDEEFRSRLNYRYKFILEDEAQDSSMTQQRILELLSSGENNWVRVGDPNQAIFETFTTAKPELLRDFIASNRHEDMPESGRSQPSILALANHLIDWVMTAHPIPEARTALSAPHIVSVPEDDPQQNPPDDPEAIKFISKKYTPEEELEAVVKSVKGYVDSIWDFPDDDKPTIAILVPRNQRGVDVVNALRQKGIEPIELISSTSETRAAAGSLSYLLAYLADPSSAKKLSKAYEVWRRDWREQSVESRGIENRGVESGEVESREGEMGGGESSGFETGNLSTTQLLNYVTALLRKMVDVENFVAPQNADDWLSAVRANEATQVIQELSAFRVVIQRWLSAVTLPIDQLVLTLAQDVFSEASDLALAHKLALVLRSAADDHADWRLPELTAELAVIAKNERRFIGFSSDDSGFDPERHRGRVVVTTMHKAKGLEWDRVYLMSVNNYDFPSAMPNDRFISEKWFIRSGLDLTAEALAQLSALESRGEYDWYEEGAATMRSRLDYVKERLRLFYVGITRAKRELIITWNSGRQGDATPSLALSELMGWWDGR